jgi:hypothetical protein
LRRTKNHPKFGIFELHFIYESWFHWDDDSYMINIWKKIVHLIEFDHISYIITFYYKTEHKN